MSDSRAIDIRTAARVQSAANHPGLVRSYFPFWDTRIRPFLILAVGALPQDRFGFKPAPALYTAHQVIVHIAEAERGWISNVVDGGDYEEWIIPNADPAAGWVTTIDAPDHTALLALLERSHRRTQHWLDQPAAELDRVVTSQPPAGPPRSMTLHWVLDRLQEHEIHHRAQLNLYLRLMGVEPPSI